MSKWVMVPVDNIPDEMLSVMRDAVYQVYADDPGYQADLTPREARAGLEAALSVAPSPWVSVLERLPTKEDADKAGNVLVWVGYWISYKWSMVTIGDFGADAVWMPMPPGPKSEWALNCAKPPYTPPVASIANTGGMAEIRAWAGNICAGIGKSGG